MDELHGVIAAVVYNPPINIKWFAGVFLFAGVYSDPTFADGFEGARDGSGSVVVVTVLSWDDGGCVRSVKGWCGGGCDGSELEVLRGCGCGGLK
ncbi:hypothetical protein L195_g025224 [Trifolium pratense]|uniref:Uncharacterized protein n=1 Tax=Trifolium pratense TaxID=57577 RepID=A0A2K3NFV8_TRIPR|nr:hypothetical protein L195_g025224 [Trifolium pratense]